MLPTRRHFLKTAPTAAVAASLPSCAPPKSKTVGLDVVNILSSTPLVNQNTSQRFDVSSLKGKPFLFMFGFEGCPACKLTTATLAKVREEYGDVPIVVVSVKPEEDKEKATEYVNRYHQQGIEEYSSGNARILNILYAGDNEKAAKLHTDLGKAINVATRSHSLNVYVCGSDGRISQECPAAFESDTKTSEAARNIIAAIKALPNTIGRSRP